jgi:hypothetical protein
MITVSYSFLVLLMHVLKIFRHLEIGMGVFKLAVALAIIIALNIVNSGMSCHVRSVDIDEI